MTEAEIIEEGESELLIKKNRKQSFKCSGSVQFTTAFILTIMIIISMFFLQRYNETISCENEAPFLLVSSHGDRNLQKFDRSGCRLSEAVLWGGSPSGRGGLRTIISGTYYNKPALYVAATDKFKHKKVHSEVAVFGTCDWMTRFRVFQSMIYDASINKTASHPYGITFDDDNNVFVSFQHTDNIMWFQANTFEPLPVPSALHRELPIGTFYQFGKSGLHNSAEQGVRGIAWAEGALWVANEDTDSVLILDKEAYTLSELFIKKPIGCNYFPELGKVFISSKDRHHQNMAGLYVYDAKSRELITTFMPDGLVHATGIQYHDGKLYVGEQESNSIFILDATTGDIVDQLFIGQHLHGSIEQIALSEC